MAFSDAMEQPPYGSPGSQQAARANCPTYANMPALAGAMADQGCQSAIDGFRSGITAIGGTVPAACQ
jgi:hypothetical protein